MRRLAATLSLFLIALPCFGATWYVSTTGNDANPCTSTGSPCLTIAHAVSLAANSDTIAIKSNGTYTITSAIATTLNPITYQGYQTTPGDGGTCATVTTATDSIDIFTVRGTATFDNLCLTTTASMIQDGIRKLALHNGILYIKKTSITGFVNCIDGNNAGSTFDWSSILVSAGSVFTSCSTNAIVDSSNTSRQDVFGAQFSSNAIGMNVAQGNFSCDHCIFNANTTAISTTAAWIGSLTSSSFLGNTTAVSVSSGSGSVSALIANNVFFGNTNGITLTGFVAIPYANFCDNTMTGGTTSMCTSTALSVSPFVSSSNFVLNSTAGGGALVKGNGYPGTLGSSTGANDPGAIQSGGSGSGSGGASAYSY